VTCCAAFGSDRLELRDVVGEVAVPAQHAVVDQHAGDGAGERLGQRGQAEHGVRVDRLRVARIGDAVAACAEDLAVLDDGHRQAGDAAIGDQLVGDRFEALHVETGGDLLAAVDRGRQPCIRLQRLWRAADRSLPVHRTLRGGTTASGSNALTRASRHACRMRCSFIGHAPCVCCNDRSILAPVSAIA
jgi:hypothetical protein